MMQTQQLDLWIREWLVRELTVPPTRLDSESTFVGIGVDSIHAMMLVGDLEEHLQLRLAPTLVWNHPTIGALAAHLGGLTAVSPPALSQPDPLDRIDSMSEEEIDRLLAEKQKSLA